MLRIKRTRARIENKFSSVLWSFYGYSKLLRGWFREGTTWGFVVRGFHEGLVWGFFVRVFTYYPAWPTKYHNRQIRQGHAAYAVRNRILDGFSYYDKELIKADNSKGLVLCQTLKLAPHERPSTQPLTKNPQQLCYYFCQTITKDPQQVCKPSRTLIIRMLSKTWKNCHSIKL